MPFTLPSLSRRHFLGASAAALAASYAWADDQAKADPHRFILMADTHIHAQPDFTARGINMTDHLAQTAKEVLALPTRASAAFVLGDLAFNEGKAEDYAQFVKLIEPLRAAGLPVHLLMGNHDHRERFWKGLPADDARDQNLAAKHVLRVKTPRANWFLLDSLDQTNKTPGVLGKEQLEWLAKELDANADKPALVCVHHNPDLRPMPGGLTDTQALYDVLLPRKQVKVLFFGHSHNWELKQQEGLHLINLPPVAYVFDKEKPAGYVELALAEDSALLKLSTLQKDHPLQGHETVLKWR